MLKIGTLIKSLLILAVWIMVGAACGPDCSDTPGSYQITSFKVNELEGDVDSSTGEMTFHLELNSSDTVRFGLVGFEIEPSVQNVALLAIPGFFSSAVALSDCIPPDPIPSQKYAAIEITSSNTFVSSSKTYAAGESLNEIFLIHGSENELEEDLIGFYAFRSGILLSLATAPQSYQAHQFKFKITLDDGNTLTANAETLTITP